MTFRARYQLSADQEERLYSLSAHMLRNIWAGLFLFAVFRGLMMG